MDWLGVFCNSLGEGNKIKVVAGKQFIISQYGVGATGESKVISTFLEQQDSLSTVP